MPSDTSVVTVLFGAAIGTLFYVRIDTGGPDWWWLTGKDKKCILEFEL
jgi:hypothetical protein